MQISTRIVGVPLSFAIMIIDRPACNTSICQECTRGSGAGKCRGKGQGERLGLELELEMGLEMGPGPGLRLPGACLLLTGILYTYYIGDERTRASARSAPYGRLPSLSQSSPRNYRQPSTSNHPLIDSSKIITMWRNNKRNNASDMI